MKIITSSSAFDLQVPLSSPLSTFQLEMPTSNQKWTRGMQKINKRIVILVAYSLQMSELY